MLLPTDNEVQFSHHIFSSFERLNPKPYLRGIRIKLYETHELTYIEGSDHYT